MTPGRFWQWLRGPQAHAARLLRGSLDLLPDVVLVIDAQGRIARANLAAAERLGAVAPEALRGIEVDALLAERLPSLAGDLPRFAGTRDTRAFALETREGSPDGDLLVKGVPRTGAFGALRGWIVTMVDIGSVREAQRERDEALRFISHDIRAPQSAILTLIEMRRHGLDGAADVAQVLGRIETLARRSLALADGFLQLARAETGIHVFERGDLRELLLEAADRAWVQAAAAGVQVRAEVDAASEPAWSAIEPSLLARALDNLLDNAVKFSPPGTRVECDVQREGPWWCLCVRDEGAGIAPHEIPGLFQRFGPRRETRRQDAGAGLGLAFVKAVVMRHRGTVEVRSAWGRGSEFRLRLPVLVPMRDVPGHPLKI